jgi:hypothetical protein
VRRFNAEDYAEEAVTSRMGYSIGFLARSPALAKRTASFMRKHYRPWPEVAGDGSGSGQYASGPRESLAYDKRKGVIGVDYGPVSGWEREYAFAIVRWMAIRAGRRRSSFRKDAVTPHVLESPAPYMTYDGYENWPILVVASAKELRAVPKSARWCATDRLGMKAEPWRQIATVLFDLKGVNVTKVMARASREAGPHPERGKHWNWVERREKALLRLCRGQFDLANRVMERELERLDALWEKG